VVLRTDNPAGGGTRPTPQAGASLDVTWVPAQSAASALWSQNCPQFWVGVEEEDGVGGSEDALFWSHAFVLDAASGRYNYGAKRRDSASKASWGSRLSGSTARTTRRSRSGYSSGRGADAPPLDGHDQFPVDLLALAGDGGQEQVLLFQLLVSVTRNAASAGGVTEITVQPRYAVYNCSKRALRVWHVGGANSSRVVAPGAEWRLGAWSVEQHPHQYDAKASELYAPVIRASFLPLRDADAGQAENGPEKEGEEEEEGEWLRSENVFLGLDAEEGAATPPPLSWLRVPCRRGLERLTRERDHLNGLTLSVMFILIIISPLLS